MSKYIDRLFYCVVLAARETLAPPALAEEYVALVIGNSAYRHALWR